MTFFELSHVIQAGLVTYPGLPSPSITPHLTREASREVYAPGTEFTIDTITMVGNTGTYLDSPFHRYPDGADLAGLPLSSLADLPTVICQVLDQREVTLAHLAGLEVTGKAVLLHTGGDKHWGTAEYTADAPYLGAEAAQWLADQGAVLVGIDSVNIDRADAAAAGARPAHSILLGADIPVVEHLTGLAALPTTPDADLRFTAAPPRISGFGTFPVRAYALIR